MELKTLQEEGRGFLVLREESFGFNDGWKLGVRKGDLVDCFALGGSRFPNHGGKLKSRLEKAGLDFLKILSKDSISLSYHVAVV